MYQFIYYKNKKIKTHSFKGTNILNKYLNLIKLGGNNIYHFKNILNKKYKKNTVNKIIKLLKLNIKNKNIKLKNKNIYINKQIGGASSSFPIILILLLSLAGISLLKKDKDKKIGYKIYKPEEFVYSKRFQGQRTGYEFKSDNKGTGYYLNNNIKTLLDNVDVQNEVIKPPLIHLKNKTIGNKNKSVTTQQYNLIEKSDLDKSTQKHSTLKPINESQLKNKTIGNKNKSVTTQQ
jgi:hypothetical protein